MKKNPYIIKFGGLPVGLHEYEFELKDAFFKEFEYSEVGRADIQAKGVLTKHNNLLQMTITFEGTVGVACDRCLREFDYPVSGEGSLVIKHGNPDETTDDILVIPEGQEEFDVSQYLYEFIVLALPARRVPCEVDMEAFICDQKTLDKLDELSRNKPADGKVDDDVWGKLNNMKFNNN